MQIVDSHVTFQRTQCTDDDAYMCIHTRQAARTKNKNELRFGICCVGCAHIHIPPSHKYLHCTRWIFIFTCRMNYVNMPVPMDLALNSATLEGKWTNQLKYNSFSMCAVLAVVIFSDRFCSWKITRHSTQCHLIDTLCVPNLNSTSIFLNHINMHTRAHTHTFQSEK